MCFACRTFGAASAELFSAAERIIFSLLAQYVSPIVFFFFSYAGARRRSSLTRSGAKKLKTCSCQHAQCIFVHIFPCTAHKHERARARASSLQSSSPAPKYLNLPFVKYYIERRVEYEPEETQPRLAFSCEIEPMCYNSNAHGGTTSEIRCRLLLPLGLCSKY